MTTRQWDKARRNERVKIYGAEPASHNARSGDSLLNHLIPTTADRAQYLRVIQGLLDVQLSDTHQCEAWFEKVAELDRIVPRWVMDDEVTRMKATLQSRLQAIQDAYDNALRGLYHARLLRTLKRLENAVEQGRFGRISLGMVQSCIRDLDSLSATVSQQERTSLRIRLRKAMQPIAVDKRAHWAIRGTPDLYTQNQWEGIFADFAGPGARG